MVCSSSRNSLDSFVRVDILLETSLMSSYRIENLDQVLHIFGYLKFHPKGKLGFDPAHPNMNKNNFQDCDWKDFIGITVKQYQGTSKCLEGTECKKCFVDANHSVDTDKRRFHTIILLLCNKGPSIWSIKIQN